MSGICSGEGHEHVLERGVGTELAERSARGADRVHERVDVLEAAGCVEALEVVHVLVGGSGAVVVPVGVGVLTLAAIVLALSACNALSGADKILISDTVGDDDGGAGGTGGAGGAGGMTAAGGMMSFGGAGGM